MYLHLLLQTWRGQARHRGTSRCNLKEKALYLFLELCMHACTRIARYCECDGFCRKEDVSVVTSISPFWPAKLSLRRQRPQRPLASATMASHAGDDPECPQTIACLSTLGKIPTQSRHTNPLVKGMSSKVIDHEVISPPRRRRVSGLVRAVQARLKRHQQESSEQCSCPL